MTGPLLRQEAAGDEALEVRTRSDTRRAEAVTRRQRSGRGPAAARPPRGWGNPIRRRTARPACALPRPEAFCPPPAAGGPE